MKLASNIGGFGFPFSTDTGTCCGLALGEAGTVVRSSYLTPDVTSKCVI